MKSTLAQMSKKTTTNSSQMLIEGVGRMEKGQEVLILENFEAHHHKEPIFVMPLAQAIGASQD